MKDIDLYRKRFTWRSAVIKGSEFKYRYLENRDSDETIVCLVGGIGLSDMGCSLMLRASEHFSVITFDYPEEYNTAAELADAAAELMKLLKIRAYFFGQSLGGMIAQLIYQRHPDVVKGLILSNTGTLCADLGTEGRKRFAQMMNGERKAYRIIKLLPFSFLKKMMVRGIEKKIKNNSEEEKAKMHVFIDIMQELLTKKYELHMISLLLDMEKHLTMTKADFASLDGRVLILTADDDETFNDDIKKTLESSVPNPVVKRYASGGHLGPFFQFDTTVQYIREFIEEKNLQLTVHH